MYMELFCHAHVTAKPNFYVKRYQLQILVHFHFQYLHGLDSIDHLLHGRDSNWPRSARLAAMVKAANEGCKERLVVSLGLLASGGEKRLLIHGPYHSKVDQRNERVPI